MQEEKKHLPKISVVIPMYNCEEFVHGVLRMFSEHAASPMRGAYLEYRD